MFDDVNDVVVNSVNERFETVVAAFATLEEVDDDLVALLRGCITEVNSDLSLSGRKTKGKKKKDPLAPKRGKNPYMFYTADNRDKVKKADLTISSKEIMQKLGSQWRENKIKAGWPFVLNEKTKAVEIDSKGNKVFVKADARKWNKGGDKAVQKLLLKYEKKAEKDSIRYRKQKGEYDADPDAYRTAHAAAV